MSCTATLSAVRAGCLEFARLETILAFVEHERQPIGGGQAEQQRFLGTSYECACRALEAANSSATLNPAEFTRFADTLKLVDTRCGVLRPAVLAASRRFGGLAANRVSRIT